MICKNNSSFVFIKTNTMPMTKEERREYDKWYKQTPKGKKSNKISDWKRSGLIWTTQEEIDEIYSRYLNSKYCEIFICSKEYTTDNKKCLDHCHDTNKFRNVICNSCNSKMNSSNTTGINGIRWDKQSKGWEYKIKINGQKHTKRSKDKDWLIEYKKDYENKYLYIIH